MSSRTTIHRPFSRARRLAALAMRLDRPKKAVIAAMSQMSSSVKPCSASTAKSSSSMSSDSRQTAMAKSSIAIWRGVMSALR